MSSGLRAKTALRGLLVRLNLFVTGDAWSVAMYEGPSPVSLQPVGGRARPVLRGRDVTDADAAFVADPFLLAAPDGWHMFFEVMNRTSGRGEIGLATSPDGLTWRYGRIVLAEPYHLSYPYVFSWDGAYYMVPETSAEERVYLYRARRYPLEWEVVDVLLEGLPFNDSSVFRHQGRWWMFTETAPDLRSDTLRLYSAPDVRGPWQEHPASPVVKGDATIARPAGRVVDDGGRLYRFAQDCATVYGQRVWAFEIIRLTPTEYEERPARLTPLLEPPAYGWNNLGMHQVDAQSWTEGRWLACVDGRPDPGPRLPDWLTTRYPWRNRTRPRLM